MSITVTVDNPAYLAAVAVKAAEQIATPAVLDQDGNVVTPAVAKTSAEFLTDFLNGSCAAWRDQLALDRVTSVAFVLRFTQAEYAALVSAAESDPILAGFVARLSSEPYVWLGSSEVQQGVGYVVSQGLLSQARAAEILQY